MKKLVISLVVMALMTAGVPMVFAADEPGNITWDGVNVDVNQPTDKIPEEQSYTAAVLGTSALFIGLLVQALSGDGGGNNTPNQHTPAVHH